MTTRLRHLATYNYPGALFPESTTREITEPTFAAAVANGPNGDGYFRKDGWYSVVVEAENERLFVSPDAEKKSVWVSEGKRKRIGHWVVGERVHYSAINDTDENRILIGNIRRNSKDGGYGVLTRCGNWQIASDFTAVIPTHSPEATQ